MKRNRGGMQHTWLLEMFYLFDNIGNVRLFCGQVYSEIMDTCR